jgi:hypothetical protein
MTFFSERQHNLFLVSLSLQKRLSPQSQMKYDMGQKLIREDKSPRGVFIVSNSTENQIKAEHSGF